MKLSTNHHSVLTLYIVIKRLIMKNNYDTEPLCYWINRIKIYKARRNSYKKDTKKYLKYDMLIKKGEYNLALWKMS